MNTAQVDVLVAETRRRVLEYFDVWTDVDATVLADFEGMLNDYRDAVDLVARARALAEFTAEMHDRLFGKEAAS